MNVSNPDFSERAVDCDPEVDEGFWEGLFVRTRQSLSIINNSPVLHTFRAKEWTSHDDVFLYVTADRAIWKGKHPSESRPVGSLASESPIDSEEDVKHWIDL